MKIAAAYIRVSTDDQIEYSPDSQLTEIRKYAMGHDMIVPTDFIFIDEGISGKNTQKRPAFNRMIGMAKTTPRPFEAILLWKFSRFARNRQDSIVYKSMLRRELGIDVISISEPIGDDKMSILFEAMIEAMDEYYSINLAEEVRRGMTQRTKAGGHNTYAPFGYRLENKQLIPDADTAPIVKKLFMDYYNGVNIRSLTQTMNDLNIRTRFGNTLSRRNIEYILTNPAYIGKVRWTPTGKVSRHRNSEDTIIADGTHPPLIDTHIFEAVQARLSEQRRIYRKHYREDGRPFLLKGLIHCSCCSGTLVLSAGGKSLQCHNYAKGKCNESHSVTIEHITNAVLQQIKKDFGSLNIHIQTLDDIQTHSAFDQKIIERQLARERLKLQRARQAYESGIDSLDEYQDNKRRIQMQISSLEKSRTAMQNPNTTVGFSPKQVTNIENQTSADIPEADLNRILSAFIQKIIFNRRQNAFTVVYHLL